MYTSNHDLLEKPGISAGKKRLVLHGIDTVGVVHVLILRLKALVLPNKVLVGLAH